MICAKFNYCSDVNVTFCEKKPEIPILNGNSKTYFLQPLLGERHIYARHVNFCRSAILYRHINVSQTLFALLSSGDFVDKLLEVIAESVHVGDLVEEVGLKLLRQSRPDAALDVAFIHWMAHFSTIGDQILKQENLENGF